MADWTRRISRSTIATRLMLVVLIPTIGCIVLGTLAAGDERRASALAERLRTEAELVELLSSASIRLAVEADTALTVEQIIDLGFDVELMSRQWEDAADTTSGNRDNLWQDLERIDAVDRSLWADPTAIEQISASWPTLRDWTQDDRSASASPAEVLEAVSGLSDAAERALTAQSTRLDALLDRTSLEGGLGDTARAERLSLSLAEAAQIERRALTEYLLPLSDGPAVVRHGQLVRAAAEFDLVRAELLRHLTADQAEQLAVMERSQPWQEYEELRSGALDRTIAIADPDAALLSFAAEGITLFIDGFERVENLSAYHREFSVQMTVDAAELEREAERRLLFSALTGFVFAGLTLATSIAVSRSIDRPVEDLLLRAKSITDGDLDTGSPGRGPSDIGQVHGVLDEMSSNLRTLSEQAAALSDGRLDDAVLDHTVAGALGRSVHGSVDRLRAMTSRLEHEASHDALTGLPNRAALLALLDRCLTGALDRRTPLSAIMFDLDGFKQANDDLGHQVGDEVLIHIARRLRAESNGSFAARLGGDEFMVIVTGDDSAARAGELAEAIGRAIAEPIASTSGSINLSASAGIVTTTGPSWLAPTEVLRRVDLAMYQAKSDSPGAIVRFDQNLHDSLLATTQLQGEIRRAIEQDEFDLHLQPIVRIADRRIVGYESLIRWHSPIRGTVPPDLFIPVAEQSELIIQIDNWVIERSAAMLAGWDDDPELADVSISVNLSARHLSHPDLVEHIETVLRTNDVRPERYVIEITESQLIPNLSRAERNLRSLRALGVRLAIDDFGTGYASVAHLRRVTFDRLKIDRSFVSHLGDETDRSLAELLVSVGRDLQLEVVAEGVETEEQFEWARRAGCSHAQGYLLGRPIDPRSVRPGPAVHDPQPTPTAVRYTNR